jgi:hypothetical protein
MGAQATCHPGALILHPHPTPPPIPIYFTNRAGQSNQDFTPRGEIPPEKNNGKTNVLPQEDKNPDSKIILDRSQVAKWGRRNVCKFLSSNIGGK